MQIKILSSTAASGVDLLKGAIAEVSDGRVLIQMGRAEAYSEAPKASKKKSK